MTTRHVAGWILALICGISSIALGQQSDTIAARKELPALEIPELTIVGKKAITLPFARKGEIYDINLYEAPAPDSSLLLDRMEPAIPVGSLPRYEQRQNPWRSSLEGSFGSFSSGGLRGYLDYSSERWGISGTGGFQHTGGHVDNSDGTTLFGGATVHSRLATDNDVLRTLRAAFGVSLRNDSYGLMGSPGSALDRDRKNIVIEGRIGSLNRQGVVLDLNLGANVWDISDAFTPIDSSVTVVSPEVGASLAADVGAGRLLGEFSFTSSSLDYQHPTESPSLLNLSGSVRWGIANRVFLQAGARYAGGSNSAGASSSLVAPMARLSWEIDEGRSLALWFEPRMLLSTYDEHVRENPYFVRELELQPERQIIHFGSTLWYNRGIVTMELSAEFSKGSGHDLTVADSAGLRVEAADVFQTVVSAEGTVRPDGRTRIRFSGAIQPSFEDGTTTQLPMTPLVKLGGRGEIDLLSKVTCWSSLEYWSKRNVDRQGTRSLGDVVQFGAGATASIFSHAVISFEAQNLLNSNYSWWEGIPAPGRSFKLGAKLRIQ